MTRIVRAAKGLLAALIATLAVWLGLIQSAAAAPALPMPAATFGCNGHDHTAVPTYTTTQRGPPVAYDRDTADFAVDDWSHGASVRPSAATTGSTTHNTHLPSSPSAHNLMIAG